MNLKLKNLIAKLAQALSPTKIVDTSYTTGTANTWAKSVNNVTIPKAGLYRIRASFSNAGVLGIGYGSSTGTNVNAIFVLKENSQSASIDDVFYLSAGTWSIWTKCSTAGKTNYIQIWRVLCP